MIIVIMGVSGCGKTTVGRLLGAYLKIPFYDADDFHPINNVRKMKNGTPLDDEDRRPWLKILADKIRDWEEKSGAVIACSALKERYREILARDVDNVKWVFLSGSYQTILSRIEKRKDHYMPKDLLKSQFDALEVPDYALEADIEKSPDEIVNLIIKNLHNG